MGQYHQLRLSTSFGKTRTMGHCPFSSADLSRTWFNIFRAAVGVLFGLVFIDAIFAIFYLRGWNFVQLEALGVLVRLVFLGRDLVMELSFLGLLRIQPGRSADGNGH